MPSGLRYRINTESFLPVLFPLLSGQRSEISKWEEESGSISVCVFLSLSFTISASMVYAPSILPYALLLWLGMFHWALGVRWTDRDPQASLIFFFHGTLLSLHSLYELYTILYTCMDILYQGYYEWYKELIRFPPLFFTMVFETLKR